MTDLSVVALVMGTYMVVLLAIGWLAYRVSHNSPTDFFLASGTIGSLVLVFTMFATIFSALTFLGAAGFGYSFGAGWFMAQGTGNALLAITLFVIGKRVWVWQQRFRYLTPAELLSARFNSPRIRDVLTAVFFITTIPYLAIQPIGAGYVLTSLTGGAVSFEVGATILMVVMVAYLLLGGLRSVAWTDTLQGLMLMGFLVVVLGFVAVRLGGFSTAAADLAAQAPELFTRPGGAGFWTEKAVLGWWLIFITNVAVQPVILLRFMSAKSLSTIRTTTIAWPFLAIVVTLMSTFVGMFGRLLVPDVEAPDQIIPALLAEHAPIWLAALILSGAMAAMMSTGDSLLHYVGASFTGDVYNRVHPGTSEARQTWMGRLAIIVVAVLGWLIALNPPTFIVQLGAATFTAIGVLMPAGVGILYWRRCTAAGVVTSVVLAELYVLGQQFGMLPQSWNLGFLSIFTGLLVAVAGLVAGSLATRPQGSDELNRYFPTTSAAQLPVAEIAHERRRE